MKLNFEMLRLILAVALDGSTGERIQAIPTMVLAAPQLWILMCLKIYLEVAHSSKYCFIHTKAPDCCGYKLLEEPPFPISDSR